VSHGTLRGGKGGILVRYELAGGDIKWRCLPDLEHRTLCRAGGLAECHTTFDVPRSFTGGGGRGRRRIDGVILHGGEPIGKIALVEPGEKFADRDPREIWRSLGARVDESPPDGWRDAGPA
jgi:hypothetical protein